MTKNILTIFTGNFSGRMAAIAIGRRMGSLTTWVRRTKEGPTAAPIHAGKNVSGDAPPTRTPVGITRIFPREPGRRPVLWTRGFDYGSAILGAYLMGLIYRPNGPALEYAPLAANLYKGCSHGCAYCYVPGIFRTPREDFKAQPRPKGNGGGSTILAQFQKEARALAKKGDKRPILLSFATDPFQPCEAEYRLTRRALKILSLYGLKAIILTKGGALEDKDFDLMTRWRHIFGVTLTGPRAKEYEPGAAPHETRFFLLRRAHNLGIRTWASIEPVIYPADSLAVIRETAAYVDHYAIGKLNHEDPPESIDWRQFKQNAEKLLQALGYRRADMKYAWEKPTHSYYLKHDLLEAADG